MAFFWFFLLMYTSLFDINHHDGCGRVGEAGGKTKAGYAKATEQPKRFRAQHAVVQTT